MADEIFDTETVAELFPDDSEVLDPADELAASDAALEADLADDDLEITFRDAPVPLGRGFAWDFRTGTAPLGGHGPRQIRGVGGLRVWIEKCLMTEAGAHPIHPDGYGLRRALNDWLGDAPSQGELREEIRSALLFHPDITELKDFATVRTETDGDAYLEISFTVQTNQGNENFATQVPITGEVL